MNVIKIRWKTIIKLIKILLYVYLISIILYWLFKPKESSLKFDPLKKIFLIKENDSDKRFPFQIKSVNIIYSKILVDDWAFLLEKAIELGVNTIQIDIAWNIHEPVHNRFDFTMKSNDLKTFIQLVHSYKLYLIVRIDPYIECSVFDMGGLPSWLLGEDDLKEREEMMTDYEGGGLLNLNDYKFLEAFQSYLDELLPILAENQKIKNGPIIGLLTQYFSREDTILTEISSFYTYDYINFLKQNLNYNDFFETLLILQSACGDRNFPQNFYSNNFKKDLKYCDPTMNGYATIYLDEKKSTVAKNSASLSIPVLNCVGENSNKYWNSNFFNKTSRIFNYKGEENHENHKSILVFKATLLEYLETHKSFNIKNYYCNTNYGFSQSAQHNKKNQMLYLSTNIFNGKYECLIDETHALTVKYSIAKGFLVGKKIKQVEPVMQVNDYYKKLNIVNEDDLIEIKLKNYLPYEKIVANLHSPINLIPEKNKLISMEYINLNYHIEANNNGFILYRAKLNLKKGFILYIKSNDIKDYSLIICDYKNHLVTINNMLITITNRTIKIKLNFDCSYLDILVENKGRLSDLSNRRLFSQERKGILSEDAIAFKKDESDTFKYVGYFMWKIHFIDFSPKVYNRFNFNSEWISYNDNESETIIGPIFSNAYFNVNLNKSLSNKLNKNKGFYLFMRNWHKGMVFLNGFNLGRYWEVGPLLTYFVPESLLIDGKNELVVFELHSIKNFSVFISRNHVST